MNEEDFEELYDQRMEAIDTRVKSALPDALVCYSVFPEGEDGLPIDILDEIAIAGKVKFVQKHDSSLGAGGDYESAIVENPNWFIVLRLAEEMIHTTGDEHHKYLEGVGQKGSEGEVAIYEFCMGS
ncbi:MAG: hypothetical protein JAZ02_09345 [Candidatus Thiodiazotropha endolucinida]|nr:hypothetical protein [Candidatus Thiodiazotropha endolucinida]